MADVGNKMRLFAILLLGAFTATAGERIDAAKAVLLAEQFVLDKGMMNPPVEAKRGDPEHLFYQGKIASKAWGYQILHKGTEYERWRVLFPITVKPVPQVKGNETAWGMLVEVYPFGDKIFVSHGVASAYDGKPFEGFTPIKQ